MRILSLSLLVLTLLIGLSGGARASDSVCPLRYSHGDSSRENLDILAARIESDIPLGTYEEILREQKSEISETLKVCIDDHKPKVKDDVSRSDPKECVQDFAVIFLDIFKEISASNQKTAPQESYAAFISAWGFMFGKPESGVLATCGLSIAKNTSIQDVAKLDTEVMLILGFSRERNDKSIGYWRALSLDLQTLSSIQCNDGCTRMFWLRKMVTK